MRSDHLVIHFDLPEVMFFSIFLFLIPFHKCRLTTLDFFVGEPVSWKKPLVCWCLGQVARFLVYFRDSSSFERLFGLSGDRFHYVPFKINAYELIRAAETCDGGYIFTGGRSRRDFTTFFSAVGSLGYPVRAITGRRADLNPNGSSLQGVAVPPNVEILSEDGSARFFVENMAHARLVVIPILKDTAIQAGIGVYLQAMALRKCVVISSGLGVADVLRDGQAIIVPAGDVDALRIAIKQAWEDDSLRERYARKAVEYALPLGGEDELRRSIFNALPQS